ncbi:hypothetical protein KM914_19355 [Virgibacillus pantothenticus]|uniref:hypothetical protein n=1 Tax=Virgibacillus pantothenticus TaxID=1473 RepID=UPI001C2451DD|nr:hypothetical protein [Virgibacillus pantothenticus]MBU8568537.1 hypothetical protein [Virgibacillus pantothenticus]MBU8602492.1 hypothetical protein [Virgibacillus pantothenticus]MBU8636675.1 hypothetical protein [Virgibacillus pantothenticus]MBU8644347.1 hypothetical protein [Virgibacillus pantothenticus]MBU8648493.1 hypothetical protein [Virgibacillus pantothenticus]
MKKEIKLDPEDFAKQVIHNYQSTSKEFETIAKEHLTLYLISYMLIERFNNLEEKNLYGISLEEFNRRLDNLQFSPGAFFQK